jgi:glucose/mannose-6-phosphate isomerase
MEKLDNSDFLKRVDKNRMGEILVDFPRQCEKAAKIGRDFRISGDYKDINKILVMGMGGSAMGGDLLKSYLFGELNIPLMVNRNYKIPHFVTRDTLVFANSYSGNTEETLSAYREARKRGAKIIGLTSGGKLKEYCQEDGNPVIIIPSGFPPRTALGYLFFPLVITLERLKLIRSKRKEIEETIKISRELSQELGPRKEGNRAKQLAQELYHKVPVVYSSSEYFEPVALRWKDQFNENSKVFAVWNLFPELNHNEIVGWEILEEITKNFRIILIRDKGDFKRIKVRMDITKSIIEKKVGGISEVWSKGNSLLARIFSLIYLGDFVSFYLAILNGADPTPVKMIDLLKKELAKKRK